MFTDVYLKTTDPRIPFSHLFHAPILMNIFFSVAFHTIVYCSFVNLVSFIFIGKILPATINYRLLFFITMIMLFGFVARVLHVKEIYRAYNYDIEKTRNHLDKLYITWMFIS